MNKRIPLSVVTVCLVLSDMLWAGNCGQFFRQRVVVRRQVVYPQAVVYKPVAYKAVAVTQPLYQVGAGLQEQAEKERIERNAVNLYKEGLADGLRILGQGAQGIGAGARSTQPTIVAKCAKCHSGSDAKGQFLVGNGVTFSPGQITKALRILSGDGVPDAMKSVIESLTPEDKGKLMAEFLSNEEGR